MKKDREIYFISDTHFGGDGELKTVDVIAEFSEFLTELEAKSNVELIIVGDAFGLWEFTGIEGHEKLDALIKQQAPLFKQLKRVGQKITITIIPGNHDYELVCFPEFVKRFKEFNIDLVQKKSLIRKVAGRKIWVEHGHQHDPANAIPDYGNPYAQPIGYFITAGIVGVAGRNSDFGRGNWLKDIQAVSPTADTPAWLLSNYFYREMTPLLRWAITPFLLLFGLSVLVFIFELLKVFGIIGINPLIENRLFLSLGIFHDVLDLIFFINGLVIAILVLAAIPLFFVLRDFKKTLKRYQLSNMARSIRRGDEGYLQAAKTVFKDKDTAVFVYGHTHEASYQRLGKQVVLNTGTWLKRYEKIPVLLGYLPPVYYPYYRLSYFKIYGEGKKLAIDYGEVAKRAPRELTLLQWLLTLSKKEIPRTKIPKHTVL